MNSIRLSLSPAQGPPSSSPSPHSIAVGKYRVATLVRSDQAGVFTAGVSIRSGRGSATTDRVMHFTPRFGCEQAARRYAHAQGVDWVASTGGAAA